MKLRYLLALLVVLGIAWSMPGPRARMLDALGPAGDALVEGWSRVRSPFDNWVARNEEKHLLSQLADLRARGQPLPRDGEFQDFAAFSLNRERGGRDPWGHPYVLRTHRDSVIVLSAGRDTILDSEDDVRAATRLQR